MFSLEVTFENVTYNCPCEKHMVIAKDKFIENYRCLNWKVNPMVLEEYCALCF